MNGPKAFPMLEVLQLPPKPRKDCMILMSEVGIPLRQAEDILEIRLRQLARLEKIKIEKLEAGRAPEGLRDPDPVRVEAGAAGRGAATRAAAAKRHAHCAVSMTGRLLASRMANGRLQRPAGRFRPKRV